MGPPIPVLGDGDSARNCRHYVIASENPDAKIKVRNSFVTIRSEKWLNVTGVHCLLNCDEILPKYALFEGLFFEVSSSKGLYWFTFNLIFQSPKPTPQNRWSYFSKHLNASSRVREGDNLRYCWSFFPQILLINLLSKNLRFLVIVFWEIVQYLPGIATVRWLMSSEVKKCAKLI